MRLILVRHCATEHTEESVYSGHSSVALSEVGETQAHLLSLYFQDDDVDTILTSDLPRALATADAIATYHPDRLSETAELREIHMGEWEGLTYAEVEARSPEALRDWVSQPVTTAPPGGETTQEVSDRIQHMLSETYKQYPEGTVMWVTHGGVISVLLSHLLGMDLARRWQWHTDPASISELEIGEADEDTATTASPLYAIVMRFNETLS